MNRIFVNIDTTFLLLSNDDRELHQLLAFSEGFSRYFLAALNPRRKFKQVADMGYAHLGLLT
jgi:hypothetical protein